MQTADSGQAAAMKIAHRLCKLCMFTQQGLLYLLKVTDDAEKGRHCLC